jgi:hypothetical protein
MSDLKETPATAWRQEREVGFLYTLPSGRVARLRPVSLAGLIRTGKIPNLLIPIVARLLWAQVGQIDARPAEVKEAEEQAHFIELVAAIVPAAVLYPKIVDNPQAQDEISIDDLTFADQLALYTIAKMPAEVLELFRQEQSATLANLPKSEAISTIAEPVG